MNIRNSYLRARMQPSKRVGLYENIAACLNENVDLLNSLRLVKDQCADNKGFPGVALSKWIDGLGGSGRLSDVLAPWVPPSELTLIEAGERNGSLTNGLMEAARLSRALEHNQTALIRDLAFPFTLLVLLLSLLGLPCLSLEL